MKAVSKWLIGACVLCAVAVCNAADLKAAQAQVTQVCQACHGMDGNSTIADNPKLGGQHPDYLAKALRDYKSGLRKNPVMAALAAQLTDRDIDNLAAYYAAQPAVLVTKH